MLTRKLNILQHNTISEKKIYDLDIKIKLNMIYFENSWHTSLRNWQHRNHYKCRWKFLSFIWDHKKIFCKWYSSQKRSLIKCTCKLLNQHSSAQRVSNINTFKVVKEEQICTRVNPMCCDKIGTNKNICLRHACVINTSRALPA